MSTYKEWALSEIGQRPRRGPLRCESLPNGLVLVRSIRSGLESTWTRSGSCIGGATYSRNGAERAAVLAHVKAEK